jgi:hypothetical protein
MMQDDIRERAKDIVERSDPIAVNLWLEFGRLFGHIDASARAAVEAEFDRRLAELRRLRLVR